MELAGAQACPARVRPASRPDGTPLVAGAYTDAQTRTGVTHPATKLSCSAERRAGAVGPRTGPCRRRRRVDSPTSSASHRNGRGQPPRGSPPEALWRTRSANSFTLPSDEEVFKMRDEEKRRKKEYRETQSKLKVWEKATRGVPDWS